MGGDPVVSGLNISASYFQSVQFCSDLVGASVEAGHISGARRDNKAERSAEHTMTTRDSTLNYAIAVLILAGGVAVGLALLVW